MDLYAETILDHYRHPRHKGSLENPTVTHAEKNLSCGDTVSLSLVIADNHLQQLAWEGDGCAISQAGMSILSEELIGKSVEDLETLKAADILTLLGIPVGNRRIKCALLCLHTLKNTLHTLQNHTLQSWSETVGNDNR